MAAAYLSLWIAVGFNEEIWFRGLLLAALRGRGDRFAIVAGAVIFALLHLGNIFTGQPVVYIVGQQALALLVGIVLAGMVIACRSLWIGIIWHAVYDYAAWLTGDSFDTAGLISLFGTLALLAVQAVWWWPRTTQAEAE